MTGLKQRVPSVFLFLLAAIDLVLVSSFKEMALVLWAVATFSVLAALLLLQFQEKQLHRHWFYWVLVGIAVLPIVIIVGLQFL